MTLLYLRSAALAAVLFASGAAYAQNTSPSPVIKSPNPATSSSTDDDGNNPLAQEGQNSPTGKGPSLSTNPPVNSTISSGVGSQKEETSTPKPNPAGK